MKRRTAFQIPAAMVLLLSCVTAYPLMSRKAEYSQTLVTRLQSDLERLNVGKEGNTVQCMDTTSGCLDALLRMNVTMSTGYVSDYYFFLPDQSGFLDAMRRDFLSQMYTKKPRFLVITSEQWPTREEEGYQQLKTWPGLWQLLTQNYCMNAEMTNGGSGGPGYRIYSLRRQHCM